MPKQSARDRSPITDTTLALENGLSQQKLAEAITHLAFYAGWPSAMTAITRLKGVVEETGGPGA
jgi:4-carboxymuconolactone decarboxylase